MATSIQNTKLRCVIDGDEEFAYYKIDLLDECDVIITTLEYSDITDDYNDFIIVNKEANIYTDLEELKTDVAQGRLNRFSGKGQGDQRVELLMTLLAKLRHQTGQCKDICIYCNPDLGSDPFPDFTFDLKNSTPEGNS